MRLLRHAFFSLLTLFLTFGNAFADKEMKVEGIFQGVNLYIMNPFATSGVGFCITKITVNGKAALDDTNRSSIELNLSVYQLVKGDKISIVITHKEGCTPKILNGDALKPKSTFTLLNSKFDKNGTFTFTTQGESGSLEFMVEQFKWKKWVRVANVTGKGTSGPNTYQTRVPLHSGINKFRIKQVDCTKKPRYSSEVSYNNLVPEVTFTPGNNGQTTSKITFSRATNYEIFDYYGQKIIQDFGLVIDVSKYPAGTYFINYDCKCEAFEKR
jgi:hypothetical protein